MIAGPQCFSEIGPFWIGPVFCCCFFFFFQTMYPLQLMGQLNSCCVGQSRLRIIWGGGERRQRERGQPALLKLWSPSFWMDTVYFCPGSQVTPRMENTGKTSVTNMRNLLYINTNTPQRMTERMSQSKLLSKGQLGNRLFSKPQELPPHSTSPLPELPEQFKC